MRTYLIERTRNTLCQFVYAFMNVPLPREVYTNVEMCLYICESVFLCVRSCVFACLRACVVSCACVRARARVTGMCVRVRANSLYLY